MFNHVMVGADDIDKSKTFYEKVLEVLGFSGKGMENTSPSGHKRVFFQHNGGTFGISQPIDGQPASHGNGSTLGFKCDSPEQVKQFHDVAVAHGGTSIEDPPGPRDGAMGPMHLSYVRDPSGNKLCAIHRPG
jgi:catechol 2,3-dioxygenase-like lactoylglutathione lyase family enzyme